MCLYVNSEKILRFYAASQESANHHIRLYCFLCKKRTCCHALQEVPNNLLSDHFDFDFDNDFLEDPSVNAQTIELISRKPYPCKFFSY